MTDIDTFITFIYDYSYASACMERYCPNATMLNYTNRSKQLGFWHWNSAAL